MPIYYTLFSRDNKKERKKLLPWKTDPGPYTGSSCIVKPNSGRSSIDMLIIGSTDGLIVIK
jgi:hypothetical protein